MRRGRILATALVALALATPAFGWSCSSEEPLTPSASAADRLRLAVEVAAERAAADCRLQGREDCVVAAGIPEVDKAPRE
jgi:hypothetical protein